MWSLGFKKMGNAKPLLGKTPKQTNKSLNFHQSSILMYLLNDLLPEEINGIHYWQFGIILYCKQENGKISCLTYENSGKLSCSAYEYSFKILYLPQMGLKISSDDITVLLSLSYTRI